MAQVLEGRLTSDEKEKLRLQLRKLSVLNPVLALSYLAVDWLTIIAAVVIAEKYYSWWSYMIAIIVISTRQNALLVIGHDAAHYRLVASRQWNTWIANLFCCYPLFFQMEVYRHHHLEHHKYNNTELDPDVRYRQDLKDFHFPMPLKEFLKLFAYELIGVTALENLKRSLKYNSDEKVKAILEPELKKTKWFRYGFYAALAIALTLLGGWKIYFLYWITPLTWIFPLIVRLKNISEHLGLKLETELNGSRDVNCSWLEGWMIAPHYIRLHLVHHLYPSVPFYRLPKMNKLLRSFEVYEREAHRNSSYILPVKDAVWRDLTRV